MIDPVQALTSQVAPRDEGEASTPEMGQQDFLKLLVAQLKNQDPLNPVQNTEFVTQLAQFTSLEQTMGINARLDLLATQTRGLANSDAVDLIGSEVSVRGNRLQHDGAGGPVQFNLAADAASVDLVVSDEFGREVRRQPLGAMPAGDAQVRWDGKNDAGDRLAPGSYVATIDARAATGDGVVVTQQTNGKVERVSFDRGYAVLTLDNGVAVPVSDLLGVRSEHKASEEK